MKIGILTLPLHTNYGGILQAYALQTVLARMGHEVILFDLNQDVNISFIQKLYKYPLRAIRKYCFMQKHKPVFFEAEYNKYRHHIRKNTDVFINQNINRKVFKNFSEINTKGYNAVIVGSDQIWRYFYASNFIYDAYLQFIKDKNIKKIAYAPSFGVDEWDYPIEITSKCKELVKTFNKVSVREKSGIVLCKKYLGIDAVHVLDPTMLLNKEDYTLLINKTKTQSIQGNIFCYVLDKNETKTNFIEKIANETNYKTFSISVGDNIQPPVEKWLKGFADAKMIITDSFHACVFSIIFNKPFLVLGNKERGQERIISLLNLFDLKDCFVLDMNNFNFKDYNINWENVNNILHEMQSKSLHYLTDSLKDK